MTRSLSRHGLLDLYGCNPALLRDEGRLKTILAAAAEAAQATVLDSRFHTFGGAGGVTGVLLLAESHISIHTWPEYGFAAVDVFLCGRMPSENARRVLEEALGAERAEWRNIPRGNAASVAGNPLSDGLQTEKASIPAEGVKLLIILPFMFILRPVPFSRHFRSRPCPSKTLSN